MTKEGTKSIISGEIVTIRPLRITDSEMEAQFVRGLSQQARRYRFFGSLKELSPAELTLLCNVDGQDSMAFVATVQKDGAEIAIGVSRYALSLKDGAREMALTVADDWQHKGLAERLLATLIEYAKGHGIRRLYCVELSDHFAMQQLAHRTGMSAERDPDDSSQVIYSLAL